MSQPRSSFQHPGPGRIYAGLSSGRGKDRVVIIAELRIAPGKLARTSYSVAKHGRNGAWELAHRWVERRWPEQDRNFKRARAEWRRRRKPKDSRR